MLDETAYPSGLPIPSARITMWGTCIAILSLPMENLWCGTFVLIDLVFFWSEASTGCRLTELALLCLDCSRLVGFLTYNKGNRLLNCSHVTVSTGGKKAAAFLPETLGCPLLALFLVKMIASIR